MVESDKIDTSAAPSRRRPLVVLAKALGWLSLIFVVLVIAVAGTAREKARRINCSGNLKCTALALIIYAGDDAEQGYFPDGDSFARLHEGSYLVNGRIYGCPSVENPATRADASDYRYFGDGICDWISNPSEVPISADRDGNHEGWYNVAFVDGHCRGYAAESWDALVREQGWTAVWAAARAESAKGLPRQP